MHNELSAPSRSVASAAFHASENLRVPIAVIFGSAFVALCAHMAVPLFFTPVPLSLAPLAVLLLGLLLSPRLAAATMGAYLAEGALGLPVFAPGPLGLAHILGPTGGYLLSYPFAAALISFVWRRSGRTFSAGLIGAAIGNLVILLSGALWLGLLTHLPVKSAISLAVIPFLPGDALKVVAAAALAVGFQRLRLRAT